MANFVANAQWDMNQLNLNFYLDNYTDIDIQQDGAFSFNGSVYDDYFFVAATDGVKNLRFDLYGTNIEVTQLGTVTSGTVQAVSEYDVNASAIFWYLDGISLDAAATVNAALSADTADDIAIIQSAFAGADTITLSPFDDIMAAFGGDDRMTGNGGNDQMDGGSGTDTAVYSQALANYTVTYDGFTATVSSAGEGTDTLTNFEFLEFNGTSFAVADFFVDTTPPSITLFSPLNGSLNAGVEQNIQLTFAETIVKGTGTIELRSGTSGGPLVESFDIATSSRVTVSGTVLTIDPTDPLDGETRYFINLPTGIVEDEAGNPFGGSVGAYNFTTVATVSMNQAPVAEAATASATEGGATIMGQLVATDGDDDALTFSLLTGPSGPLPLSGVTINADGSWTFDPSGTDYDGLSAGQMVDLVIAYQVSDGELTDDSTLTITLTGVNDDPAFQPSTGTLVTSVDMAITFTAPAVDPDGDALTYSSSNPANGTVTGGAGGQFTYTPDSGFEGTDTLTLTVSDGNGGTDTLGFVVTVSAALETNWRLVARDGLVGKIGQGGEVFGTQGFQDITIYDLPGNINFDPSSNAGGDILRLAGDASDWTIRRVGSAASFSDGDTTILLPASTAGSAIVFDDGARTFVFDGGIGSLRIGAQAFSFDEVQINTPADGDPLPTGANAAARGNVVMAEGGVVTAAGDFDFFGTRPGFERITLNSGDTTFDPSFNEGGDTIIVSEDPEAFTAARVGSSVRLDGSTTDLLVPIGQTGTTITFPGGDDRLLLFDGNVGAIVLGDQQIGNDPIALFAAI